MLSFRKRSEKARARRLHPVLEGLEGRVVLSTFNVNTFADTVAVNPKTSPKDSSGHISLRSAIMAADANPTTSNTIILPAGTFNLTIAPTGNDGPSSGDLDILVDNKLTIQGSTKGGQSIINGNNLDRVFLTESGKVAISNVVIEHGSVVGQGGGLLNDGATDTLTSVQFFDDFANGRFGGNGTSGTTNGDVGTNGKAGGAGGAAEGGAICNLAGSLTLTNCFFNANEAIGGDGGHGGAGGLGGGANNREGQFNGAAGDGGAGGAGGAGGVGEGGGVFNGPRATLILSNDSFFKNEALGGSGGTGGNGGIGQGGNGANDTGAGAGIGGSAGGGRGGAGGIGGLGAGGGIYNGGGKITLVGPATTFTSNEAGGELGGNGGAGGKGIGGSGGNGISPGAGNGAGTGDAGTAGGAGGAGGQGGAGLGGAIFNARNGSISSTTAVLVFSNSALGFTGGNGGNGGNAFAGSGGNGGNNTQDGPAGSGAAGGDADGGNGGAGGSGGVGEGGGIFNAALATITFTAGKNTTAPPVSTFSANKAQGGNGGHGGVGGDATAGSGGNAGTSEGSPGAAGGGGSATSGNGGNGGAGALGNGGGFYDDGTASFTGVTVSFKNDQAVGGSGGNGFVAGNAFGGTGGTNQGGLGGNGGNATGGAGGNAGFSGVGSGGGITVDSAGTLFLRPRFGAPKRSKQASATDVITLNSAIAGVGGIAGSAPGSVTPGGGGPGDPPGAGGTANPGRSGSLTGPRRSVGGGMAIFGKATGDNTSVTGNNAIKFPNIDGTLST